jgi:hypothetical protein
VNLHRVTAGDAVVLLEDEDAVEASTSAKKATARVTFEAGQGGYRLDERCLLSSHHSSLVASGRNVVGNRGQVNHPGRSALAGCPP